jgi:ribonuclease III
MDSPTSQRLEEIGAFLTQLGLRPSSLDLVDQSLVHRSYAFEHNAIPDNERLEFLGDAVLGCIVSRFLFDRFPDEPEGDLSRKKAFLVSRSELGKQAKRLGLTPLILLGRGEESSGGRSRSSLVGSALEALVGALFLGMEFEELSDFVYAEILAPALENLETEGHTDYKSRLQELVQKHGQDVPAYEVVEESGPPHQKEFVIEVSIEGQPLGRGEGKRIKEAENNAARVAYGRAQNRNA